MKRQQGEYNSAMSQVAKEDSRQFMWFCMPKVINHDRGVIPPYPPYILLTNLQL